MSEAWIIDGLRSPPRPWQARQGRSRAHAPAAQPRASAEGPRRTHRLRPGRRRRRGRGLWLRQWRPRTRHRAHVRTRRWLAHHRLGSHAAPLLRFGPASGLLRRHGDHGRASGSRGRGRSRVDVSLRADPRSTASTPTTSTSSSSHPDGAPGHLGGPDRDPRGLFARGLRFSYAVRSQERAAEAIEDGRFDQEPGPRS